MFISKEEFEIWMQRIMARFDKQERKLDSMNKPHQTLLEGEVLFDNQDLCQLLHISKRTLQRYRDSNELPFQRLHRKTYYKGSDVQKFIINNFSKKKGKGGVDVDKEDIGFYK